MPNAMTIVASANVFPSRNTATTSSSDRSRSWNARSCAGFAAPEGAGLLRRLLVYGLTVGGEGIDPSYLTFFIPLFVVPIVSLMTSQGKVRDDFYEMLSGRTPVEEEQVAGAG